MPSTDVEEKTGDILATSGENPVIHAAPVHLLSPTELLARDLATLPDPPVIESKEAPAVEANISLARDAEGAWCIRISGRRRLSAAEAHRLAIDLTEAADHIGDIRAKQGFDA